MNTVRVVVVRVANVDVVARPTPPPSRPAALVTARALGLTSGIVVADPVPEAEEIPAAETGAVIDRALADLDARGIAGKEATPYLLRPDRRARRR